MQHPVLAVDGHDVLRLDQIEHQLQLFRVAVAGNVDDRNAVVEHFRAAPEQVVDGAVD